MSAYPLPCPFCGELPNMTSRPDNLMKTEFFAAVACYCGGYSACAHKMACAPTQAEAEAQALAAWNERKTPNARLSGPQRPALE